MRPQQSSTGWASSFPRCDVMVEPCPEAGICHRPDGTFEVEMSARSLVVLDQMPFKLAEADARAGIRQRASK